MNLYGTSRFGELKQGKIIYSFPEALYLSEKSKISVYFKNKKMSFEKLIEKIHELDPRIHTKYTVFKNLRERGYIVKTALKFGAEFRVYNKGKKPGQEHAKWILYPVKESDILTWHDFAAKNRVAHSTRKNLLIAIVDEESDITYYEISWTKP
jgi:tRNA-intron endonuclease